MAEARDEEVLVLVFAGMEERVSETMVDGGEGCTRRLRRDEVIPFDALRLSVRRIPQEKRKNVQSKSMRSVPFDAIGSINSHSGTTTLIFVLCVSRASGPRVRVSLRTIIPAERAVNSFEFDAILNKVYSLP